MSELTLTADQAQQLAAAELPMVVRSPEGEVVGMLTRTPTDETRLEDAFTPEEIAEAEREARENPERRTWEQVRQRLDDLEKQFGL